MVAVPFFSFPSRCLAPCSLWTLLLLPLPYGVCVCRLSPAIPFSLFNFFIVNYFIASGAFVLYLVESDGSNFVSDSVLFLRYVFALLPPVMFYKCLVDIRYVFFASRGPCCAPARLHLRNCPLSAFPSPDVHSPCFSHPLRRVLKRRLAYSMPSLPTLLLTIFAWASFPCASGLSGLLVICVVSLPSADRA